MPKEVVVLFGLIISAGTFISLTYMVLGFFKGRHAPVPDSGLQQQLDDMRERLESAEERLDFAERLLAKQRDAERLPGRP